MQEKICNWETNASPPPSPGKTQRLNVSRSWQKQGERETLQREIHLGFLVFTCIPAAKFPNPCPWEGEACAWPLRKAGDNEGDPPVAEPQLVPAPGQGEMHSMGTGGTPRICRFWVKSHCRGASWSPACLNISQRE